MNQLLGQGMLGELTQSASTITGTIGEFNAALVSNDFCTLAGAETLTNKTLTNPTVNGYTEGLLSIGNSGAAQTLAIGSATVQSVTLTANCVFTMPTATPGKSFQLYVYTGAGSFTGTFTGVKWPGNVAPIITPTAGRYDIVSFVANPTGSVWSGSILPNYTA